MAISTRVRRLLLLAALCLALSCGATTAAAEEVAKPGFANDPFHLEVRLGLGTLVSFLGLTGGVNVADWLEIGAGAGVRPGLVIGAYGRLRPLYGATSQGRLHALTIELGYSTGPSHVALFMLNHAEYDPRGGFAREAETDRAHFAQAELGWETRSASGFALRFAGGVAISVHGDWRCEGGDGITVACPEHMAIPTFTVGVGGW